MVYEYKNEELIEAKKQIDSALHKTREVLKTFMAKENPNRYKSQITLAKRRIAAFEISVSLIKLDKFRFIRTINQNSAELTTK